MMKKTKKINIGNVAIGGNLPLAIIAGPCVIENEKATLKIAEKLINRVQEVVKGLGLKTLYLRTEHTSEYYRRLGWEYVYKTNDEKGQETEVFRISVNN